MEETLPSLLPLLPSVCLAQIKVRKEGRERDKKRGGKKGVRLEDARFVEP